jgi:hypothetical protein
MSFFYQDQGENFRDYNIFFRPWAHCHCSSHMSGLNTTKLTWAKINKLPCKKMSQCSYLQKLLEMTSDAKEEVIHKAWAGCSRHVKFPEKLYW